MKKIISIAILSIIKSVSFIFVITTSLMTFSVQAIECEFTKLFNENVAIPVIGPGLSTIGEDVPIGKVLYRQDYRIGKTTSIGCTVNDDEDIGKIMRLFTKAEVISTPSGIATRMGDKDIFPTNVSGIGAAFYLSGPAMNYSSFPFISEKTYELTYGTTTSGLNLFSKVVIELIKTGPIESGVQQIESSSFPVFQISSGLNSPISLSNNFLKLSFIGTTTMHTKTCQLVTSNIAVNLNNHAVSEFTSPGTATAWKDFDIVLKGCPPFYGYGNYTFNERTNILSGSNTENVISIGFKSVNGTIEDNPYLAKIDSGPNAATGVGIELAQKNISGSIPLDGTGVFDLPSLQQEDNASYIISLKARYVQTDSKVNSGIANGSVVFTITYL